MRSMNAKLDEWKGLCEASRELFSRAAESVWMTLPSEIAGDVSMLSQYLGCDYQLYHTCTLWRAAPEPKFGILNIEPSGQQKRYTFRSLNGSTVGFLQRCAYTSAVLGAIRAEHRPSLQTILKTLR